MEMIPVDSSQIAQIGHDGQNTLGVIFRRGDGSRYEYPATTAEFQAFRDAESLGRHFGQFIKPKTFKKNTEFSAAPSSAADVKAKPEPKPLTVAEAAPEFLPENQNQEVEKVATKSSLLVQNATSIKVTNETTQRQASDLLLGIAAIRKEIEATFKPMKDAAHRAHKVICEQEKKIDDPLAQAERAVKGQIGSFVQEQTRLARLAEQALREAEMERARVAAEKEAQELAIEDALVLEAQGNMKAAEAVLANPAPAPIRYAAPAPIAPQVAQVSGISTREDWDFRIVNEAIIPRDYLVVNESLIRSTGKNSKGKVKIPGVEFYPKQVVSASRGR